MSVEAASIPSEERPALGLEVFSDTCRTTTRPATLAGLQASSWRNQHH